MEVETDFEGLLDHIIPKEKKNDEESELINIASQILSTNFLTTTNTKPNPAVVVVAEEAIVAAAIETPKEMEGVTDTTNEKQPPPAIGIDSETRASKSSACPKTPPHKKETSHDEEVASLSLRAGILDDPETPPGCVESQTT